MLADGPADRPFFRLQVPSPPMQVEATPETHRVEATVRLLAERGYALPVHEVARLCVGGSLTPEAVEAAVVHRGDLCVTDGIVHVRGAQVEQSLRRQSRHEGESPRYWAVASAYMNGLARHCPWLEAAWVAGSLSSGGFEAGDDIDLNLLVEDDAKYLTYVWALLLSVPVSWRLRREFPRTTPVLPKVVCINVVWERHQAFPFVRSDDRMGMELLLSRPVHGSGTIRACFEENPGLTARFPQLCDVPVDPGMPVRPSPLGRSLAILTRPRVVRRVLDHMAYAAVWMLHAYVRFHRRHDHETRRHVEEMEAHKEPYGILERPRRLRRPST